MCRLLTESSLPWSVSIPARAGGTPSSGRVRFVAVVFPACAGQPHCSARAAPPPRVDPLCPGEAAYLTPYDGRRAGPSPLLRLRL